LIRRLFYSLAVTHPGFALDPAGSEMVWRILTNARNRGHLTVSALDPLSIRLLLTICRPGLLLYAEAEEQSLKRPVPLAASSAALMRQAAPALVWLLERETFTPALNPLARDALLGNLCAVQGLFNAHNPRDPDTVLAWAVFELLGRSESYNGGPSLGFCSYLFAGLVDMNLSTPPSMPPWPKGSPPAWFSPRTPKGSGVLLDRAEREFLWCSYERLGHVERLAVMLAVFGGLHITEILPLLAKEDLQSTAIQTSFFEIFECMTPRQPSLNGATK